MATVRERSTGPASAAPRMLRIEFKGQPYDWFNLDEMGDIVRTTDFSNTLKENITHYFKVPLEHQMVYDEEGLLCSMVDFSRALRSVRPWLRVYDARDMKQELKEKTVKQLEEVHAEVVRSQRSLSGWGTTDVSQQLFKSPAQNGYSPSIGPRDSALSLADAVRNASGGAVGNPYEASQLTPPKPLPQTAFPWSSAAALEACNVPGARYPTPPPQGYHQQARGQMAGVMPSQARTFQPQQMPQQDIWRQSSATLGSLGGGSTPPQPAGAIAAAALAGSVPMNSAIDNGVYSSRPASAREIPRGMDPNQQAGGLIEVVLTKEPPGSGLDRFGFANVPARDGRELVISWIQADGLLELRWNRRVPMEKQVREGDTILSVNGRRDDVEAMRDQLQMPSVNMIVQRRAT